MIESYLRCDECGTVILDVSRLAEIHSCGRQGALRLVLLTPEEQRALLAEHIRVVFSIGPNEMFPLSSS